MPLTFPIVSGDGGNGRNRDCDSQIRSLPVHEEIAIQP